MNSELHNSSLENILQGRDIPRETQDFYKTFVKEIILGYDGIEDPNQLSNCKLLNHYYILKKFCQSVGCCLMFNNSDGSNYLVKSSKCQDPDENLAILFFYRELEKDEDCISEKFYLAFLFERLQFNENERINNLEGYSPIFLNNLENQERLLSVISDFRLTNAQEEQALKEALVCSFHRLKIPRIFPIFMTLYNQARTLFGILCYACNKFLPPTYFSFTCPNHELLSICNKHFTKEKFDKYSCPHCNRSLNSYEIQLISESYCLYCNQTILVPCSHCNYKLCPFCMSSKCPMNRQHNNKRNNKGRLICIDCLNSLSCPNCSQSFNPVCSCCDTRIVSNIQIMAKCDHLIHRDCNSKTCTICYKSVVLNSFG